MVRSIGYETGFGGCPNHISEQYLPRTVLYGVGTDTWTSFEFPLVPFEFTAWTT